MPSSLQLVVQYIRKTPKKEARRAQGGERGARARRRGDRGATRGAPAKDGAPSGARQQAAAEGVPPRGLRHHGPRGGVCIWHGALRRPRLACREAGCLSRAYKGRVCKMYCARHAWPGEVGVPDAVLGSSASAAVML